MNTYQFKTLKTETIAIYFFLTIHFKVQYFFEEKKRETETEEVN